MFCVICFEDCGFLFGRGDKEIYSKCADAEMEKEYEPIRALLSYVLGLSSKVLRII